MLIVDLEKEKSPVDYLETHNVVVLPITKFVRKDGFLATKNDQVKSVFSRYKNMPKKWGYLLSNGVEYPYLFLESGAFLGLPDREHYASAFNSELWEASMLYLLDEAVSKPYLAYYLSGVCERGEEIAKSVHKETHNVILLRGKEE